MIRRLNMTIVLGAIVVLAAATGTAALTSVTIDRNVTASVAADNASAAVKLECVDNTTGGGNNYSNLCQYTNGVLSLELHRAVNSGGTVGFNPSATFTIGAATANNRVLKVTNNTQRSVKVQFDATAIAMKLETTGATVNLASPVTLTAGQSKEFFFTVTVPAAPTALTGTLQVREV